MNGAKAHLKSLLLLAPALAFGGCVRAVVPQMVDPFDSLRASSDSPYKNLVAAVLTSDNTRNAIKYTREVDADAHHKVNVNADQLFLGFSAILQRNFKSTIPIRPGEDASGADLIVVVDIHDELPIGYDDQKFDAAFILTTPSKEEIDTVRGHGASPAHIFWSPAGIGEAAGLAAEQAQKELEASLLSSPKLLEYARTRRGAEKKIETASAAAPERLHSDVDSPKHHLAENPDDFAIVVGIEKYSNDLPDAQFAERDAQAMRDHLLALGYPERNVKFLAGSRAVRSSLEAYLEDWLPRNVKADSRVFFYFSGHGAPAPESGQAYLVPWDGNPNFLDKTGYPVKKLYADLNALKVKQVIVALDSCFSGAGGRSLLPEGSRPLVNNADMAVAGGGKIMLFAAASPKEITSTLKEQGHGLFTYYFLKGLDGAAQDASGSVTPRGLFSYLKPKVQDAASRQNRDQTPVLDGMTTGDIVKFR